MAQIIDGKAVSASVKEEVAAEAARLKDEKGLKVGLAVVIVGNNPASRVYVNNKKKEVNTWMRKTIKNFKIHEVEVTYNVITTNEV